MAAELVLDTDHEYWLTENGVSRYCVGCTNALKSVGLLDARYYTDEGQLRGTAVHQMIARNLNGEKSDRSQKCKSCDGVGMIATMSAADNMEVDEHECPECDGTGKIKLTEKKRLSGYVQAAERYLADSKAEILNVEFSLADPFLLMAGTPDLIAQVIPPRLKEHRFAVIDWKTGQPESWHAYQTAWYEHLAQVNKLVEGSVERIVVHLRENGTYTIRTFRERSDWKVADAARVVEQAKRAA